MRLPDTGVQALSDQNVTFLQKNVCLYIYFLNIPIQLVRTLNVKNTRKVAAPAN